MAVDHFIKHEYSRKRTDWNFNILFDDQPQVAKFSSKYNPIIKHPGLYEAVPSRWLHATVLRVGFIEEFSEAEMLAVAEILKQKLVKIKMPELTLGQRWWLWNGGPVLSITPKKELQAVFKAVLSALVEVIGRDRLPELTIASKHHPMKEIDQFIKYLSRTFGRDRIPANLQFTPHVTLAYPRTYQDEFGLFKQLRSHPIEGINIRALKLSLIKQRVEKNYYVWDVIKELPIGQEFQR